MIGKNTLRVANSHVQHTYLDIGANSNAILILLL